MEILKFKTDIYSSECLDSVAPLLDNEQNIHKWNVDTDSPDNILSVSGEELNPQTIKNLVAKVGFSAEVVRIEGLNGSGL